ncbi:polysaccharide biosynthesis/export family protein [Rubrivivax rivuli]|uniref:polysaccharide biosynthesis/export family protein n=1 Tax=Rubrivivax rivuli TaxID=1862385 RepID=UPI0013E3CFDA|nr:polysaccharide biosynthesis/export family protein [Rubrivivax rivuli]
MAHSPCRPDGLPWKAGAWQRLGAAAAGLLAAVLLTGCGTVDLGVLFRSPPAEPVPAAPAPTAMALPWGTTPAEARAAAQAASPAPGADPARAAEARDPAYRIGPEDGLEIAVWKDDSLKSTVLVRPDGGISFPLVGELPVAGLTAAQVREEIATRLRRFVPDAEVTVSVVRVASYRVYVTGRVNRPGEFAVGRTLDVLQALSLAGGMTPFADESEIRIIRREGARQLSIPFDYRQLRKGQGLAQNILLRSGDVVLVP